VTISGIIGGAAALLSSIGGGIYYLDEHFLTRHTGLPREEGVTVVDLEVAQNATHDYLLDLRIEQAEQRRRMIEREIIEEQIPAEQRAEQRKRDLNRIDVELERLYRKREELR